MWCRRPGLSGLSGSLTSSCHSLSTTSSLSYLSPFSSIMSVPKLSSSCGPELCNPPPFTVSHYMPEYASYMYAVQSIDLFASDKL